VDPIDWEDKEQTMNARQCCLLCAVLSVMLLLSLAVPVRAQHAQHFLYLTVDPPSTLGNNAEWVGINDLGELDGVWIDANTGLYTAGYYRNGSFTELPIPNSTFSALNMANNHGTAVGNYTDLNNFCHSFTRAADGTITYLPDVVPGGSTVAYYLNDNGVFVGYYSAGSIGGNPYGPIGPIHGFIYKNGRYTTYDFPGETTTTLLLSINNHDEITGAYTDASGMAHSFLLKGHKTSPIVAPGPDATFVAIINNVGEINGWLLQGPWYNPTSVEGFMLRDHVFTELIYPDSVWTLPLGLNDYGMTSGGYMDQQGVFHGFVAVPVP
jgi:hypothetical protein